MRILALSDVHYPSTDKEDLASALRQAKADKVVFLGDTVEDRGRAEEFLEVVRSTGCWDYTFLQGDEDEGLLGEKYLEVTAAGKRFIFTHGNQFNIHSDRLTRRIVRALKRIHHSLPVLAYVIRAKLGFRTDSGYLILGHSH
ncbi:MAG TPA: metallophosphoesterase family protein, partial [Nitrososphaerales archaeon]|nr:metallophosphoesterase family protein [Nitrososphaerales archaeon]